MQNYRSRLFLRLLLNKFHPTKQEAVFKFLPEALQQNIKEMNFAANTPATVLSFPTTLLNRIHYSWLTAPLERVSPSVRNSIISSLPQELRQKLATKETEISYSPAVKNFLLNEFSKAFGAIEVLPEELLSPTPVDALLTLSKQELVKLIDLLAMQDLAEEVRHIVDKKLIMAIVADLTPLQQKYLKQCLHNRAKIATVPLNAKETHKDQKAFQKLIHKRGLKRLATALAAISEDFVWYVCHTLDRGRGNIIFDHLKKEEVEMFATQVVQIQIGQVIPLIKSS